MGGWAFCAKTARLLDTVTVRTYPVAGFLRAACLNPNPDRQHHHAAVFAPRRLQAGSRPGLRPPSHPQCPTLPASCSNSSSCCTLSLPSRGGAAAQRRGERAACCASGMGGHGFGVPPLARMALAVATALAVGNEGDRSSSGSGSSSSSSSSEGEAGGGTSSNSGSGTSLREGGAEGDVGGGGKSSAPVTLLSPTLAGRKAEALNKYGGV